MQHDAEHPHAGHMRQQHREWRKPDGRARPDCADSHDAQRGLCAISGEGKVNGEVLPTHALAFFTKGEACSVENMSDATLRLFCMQAD